jgi:hypothetical protein
MTPRTIFLRPRRRARIRALIGAGIFAALAAGAYFVGDWLGRHTPPEPLCQASAPQT